MEKLHLEKTGYAIPFKEIKRLIEFYPRGNPYRLAYLILALTGCRLSELENIGAESFCGDFLIWKTGKRQRGYRRKRLPNWFFSELEAFLTRHPHTKKRLFMFNGESLSRHTNKHVRPKLGNEWIWKRPSSGLFKQEHIYELKGLRHSYASVEFQRMIRRYGSAELAISAVAVDMRHSSHRLTAEHYVEDMSAIGNDTLDMENVLKTEQRKLLEFF